MKLIDIVVMNQYPILLSLAVLIKTLIHFVYSHF